MPHKRESSSSSEAALASNKKLKKDEETQTVEHPDAAVALQPSEKPEEDGCRFVGDPVPDDEARRRWPHRYAGKGKGKETAGFKCSNLNANSEEIVQGRCHYTMAEVDGRVIFNLEDEAHVKADEGKENFICRIIEMFEGTDRALYFTAQWYYRATDTVIQNSLKSVQLIDAIDDKRVFFSEVKDDNPLNCLIERIRIVRMPSNVDLSSRECAISDCDYYCDTKYLGPYSSFVNLPLDNVVSGSESGSTLSSDSDVAAVVGGTKIDSEEVSKHNENKKAEMTLLDLYCGCGAMSTGLCLGANMGGVNLVTKWAVDQNSNACESLRYNHPETEVRNENAEDFLALLKEWKKLCDLFPLIDNESSKQDDDDCPNEQSDDDDGSDDSEVFEVEKILAICYGEPKGSKKLGLHFKIHWKGYGSDEDSWEPQDGLGTCKDAMKEFVHNGCRSKILPLPGDVDVICGGPPCQGISGFNRFRNKDDPLQDPKNKQLTVFMDFVKYLKPRFVLMENVVDMLKFAGGFLGRYALGRLVGMNYQARLGIMAAGAYGLPQFRMRVFLWGAHSSEKLPQYPLPTHNVVLRGGGPTEFEGNVVAYEEGRRAKLEKELFLKDAISDLPPVNNDEERDEMPYQSEAMTEFQQFIRLGKDELLSCSAARCEPLNQSLYDHRPLRLSVDDYQRVCQIPKRKGANFRHLEGVRVCADNKVEWDPDVKRVYLASGKPLVPDYAMTYVKGYSSKPFGRLWWDETVPTVVTRAEPHNQVILHPEQDRVLTVRENARLQGFPDYYKLFGVIKERYIQVGNAVAVPVSRSLGYALAMAAQGLSGEEPVFTLPEIFSRTMPVVLPVVEDSI
ncbi:hypothetical protein RHGRI_015492 [Rhododendron griersonianum]|uniref:DNA (cytosine-5-)-methyltransferase n=1 Tax=Rhododendron griersonianum TaxID=479676 RepID=A0AAV6KDF2_9ERIC|nr:hypothetical protein RHGRI_015492 [Rhododendron griersonianum]